MDQGLLSIAEAGEAITLSDYLRAVQSRGALGTALKLFHARYPVLLTSTLPIPAFDAGRLTSQNYGEAGGDWTIWAPFSYPFNLSQQLPCRAASRVTDWRSGCKSSARCTTTSSCCGWRARSKQHGRGSLNMCD